MKKRNIIAIIAALSVILTAFTACGDKKDNNETGKETTAAVADGATTQANGNGEGNKIEYIEVTEVVTDASGEPVTNADGETKVETVTKPAPTQPSTNGGDETTANSGSSVTTPSRKLQKLAAELAGKKSFTFDGTVSTGTEEMSAKMYVKGDKVAIEANMGAMAVRIIYANNSVKMVMPSLKYYMTMPSDSMDSFNADELTAALGNIDSKDLEYVGTTNEKVDGKSYVCETYKDGVNTNKYYFDSSDNLKRIEIIDADGNKNITKVNEFSANVPDSAFTVPADYKELTEDQIGALAGMMGGQ